MLRVTEFAPDRMIHITKLRKLNIWCAGNHQYMRGRFLVNARNDRVLRWREGRSEESHLNYLQILLVYKTLQCNCSLSCRKNHFLFSPERFYTTISVEFCLKLRAD